MLMASLNAGLITLVGYLSAHVLTCLVPAFFIAGAIAALLKTEVVLKYFGADAPKWLCYSVAATSGTILAVCSCTILPMFAGIEKKSAGIGPATAFLFSGPAINLLAIVLTARVLGLDIGIARAIAAVSMAVIIGLIMAAIFERRPQKCEISPGNAPAKAVDATTESHKGGQTERISVLFLALLIGVLLSATSQLEFSLKWTIVAAFIAAAAYVLARYFSSKEKSAFFSETWSLTKKIFPLLLVGTFITGMIGYFLPVEWVRTVFRYEQLPGVLHSLCCRGSTLHAHSAGDTHSGNALRLQHRSDGPRSGAISAPGRAIAEPTKHDSNYESNRL
jgi:uncharacterized membrane protein YraQ (UPF0718 family)